MGIIEINQLLKDLFINEEIPISFKRLLTVTSRIYFETYFLPTISVHKQVREMYLNFKVNNNVIPVLVNLNERNGLYEGIVVQIQTRDEYEVQLMTAKKNAERIQKETDVAFSKLQILLSDVGEKQQILEKLNNELEVLAAHDELTGLLNRRIFDRDLAYAIDRAHQDPDSYFSLVILDIDHFKQVNDKHGHFFGDKVLIELTHKMEQFMRPPHIIARIGGEEFGMIFYETNFEKKINEMENLREYIACSVWKNLSVTVSLGITHFQEGDTSSIIFKRADEALYHSKQNGRNRLTYL